MVIPEPKEERWSDFVDDLWDRKLPHFRRKGYVYSNGPSSPVVKTPEETPRSSKMVKELIHYSSEINMLELMDEDEDAGATPFQGPTPSEPGTVHTNSKNINTISMQLCYNTGGGCMP
jgi:hypothetical protein